jgi:hypothetical protein
MIDEVKRTNVIAIEESGQQYHLKGPRHATEDHEQGSHDRHHVVEQQSFFP